MSNKTPQSQPDKFIVETLKSGGTKYSIKIGDWVIQFSHDADESVGVVTLSKGSEIHWQSVYDGEQEPPPTDINAADIPTPSKGQETKEEGAFTPACCCYDSERCIENRGCILMGEQGTRTPPNREQGAQECDASKCVEN